MANVPALTGTKSDNSDDDDDDDDDENDDDDGDDAMWRIRKFSRTIYSRCILQ